MNSHNFDWVRIPAHAAQALRRYRLIVCLAATAGLTAAYATPPDGFVTYSPATQSLAAIAPLTRSYTLGVTCPGAVAKFPVTVTLRAQANNSGEGDDESDGGHEGDASHSYVSFSSPTLTFGAPGETQTAVVTVSIPADALGTGTAAATFSYTIYTDGWPAPALDPGATLTALVQIGGAVPGNPPAIEINSPGNYASLSYEGGTFPHTVAFDFTAATDASSPLITGVDARFGKPGHMDSVPVVTNGLGTAATVTGSGSITFDHPGKYQLSVTAANVIGTALAEHTINVVVSGPPPQVEITSPSQHPVASYTYRLGDPALQVPFSFAASTKEGSIVSVAAQVDGVPLVFSVDGLNTPTASGTVHLTYDSAAAQGTHTLWVTATDEYGLVTTETGSFSIDCALPTHAIGGTVFFDLDSNGAVSGFDFGLAGVTVRLRDSAGKLVATTMSGADGAYAFPGLAAGTYSVEATAFPGVVATTKTAMSVGLAGADAELPQIGFRLDFSALRSVTPGAHLPEYWKYNLDRAIAHRSGGTVSASKLHTDTVAVSQLALPQFDGTDEKAASAVLGTRSFAPADLLAKQLLAAEYNYENGAYIGGNATLTYAVMCWGEAVLSKSDQFSREQLLAVTLCFAAYNLSGWSPFPGGWR